jgi:hypothetical protein
MMQDFAFAMTSEFADPVEVLSGNNPDSERPLIPVSKPRRDAENLDVDECFVGDIGVQPCGYGLGG